jgi:hypothetical protein
LLGLTDELVDVCQFRIKAFDIFVMQLPEMLIMSSPSRAMPGEGDKSPFAKMMPGAKDTQFRIISRRSPRKAQ